MLNQEPRLFLLTQAAWLFLALSCGSPFGGGISLEVRFATREAAEIAASGLPLGIQSYKVEAWAGSVGGELRGGTGCVDVGADDPGRNSVRLYLDPHDNLILVVNGYGSIGCADNLEWMGMTTGVVVREGRETRVSIYVTRRGFRLNPTRAQFRTPRAFASATPLPDGRVLLAGGFEAEGPLPAGSEVDLQAACDALIYNPQTGGFGAPVPFKAGCRGIHRAMALSDGKVLLVGGASRIRVRFQDYLLVRAGSGDAVSTADLFDPATGRFTAVGSAPELERADAAAVAMGDDRVVVLGGRTTEMRSAGIVVGSRAGNQWSWETPGTGLLAARSGAQAVLLEAGILLAGGNLSGTESLELLDRTTFGSSWLSPSVDAAQSVTGHTLTPIGPSEAVMVGGIPDDPGGQPVRTVLAVGLNSASPTVWQGALGHARAYHAAALLLDGRMVFAGGLDDQLSPTKDLEILAIRGSREVLQDSLGTGSIGLAAAMVPDGSVLLAGGLDLDQLNGLLMLSSTVQLLSP